MPLIKIKDLPKLLQFSGALPVEFEISESSNQNRRRPSVRLKFLSIYIVQVLLLFYRFLWSLAIIITPEVKVISKVVTVVNISWITIATLLPLTRLQGTVLCLQQATQIISPTADLREGFAILGLVLSVSFFFINQELVSSQHFRVGKSWMTQGMFEISFLCTEFIPMMLITCIMMILFGLQANYDVINERISSAIKNVASISSQEVAELAQRHWRTGDLIESLNDVFGLDLLLFSAFNFVKLALQLYLTFLSVVDVEGEGEPQGWAAFRAAGKSFVLMTNVLLLSMAASHPQRTETLGLLYRLLRRCTGDSTVEDELKRQIRIFQTQIRSRDLHLSACGFFDIDKSHFYGLIMQVTNYFILLLQFQAFQ